MELINIVQHWFDENEDLSFLFFVIEVSVCKFSLSVVEKEEELVSGWRWWLEEIRGKILGLGENYHFLKFKNFGRKKIIIFLNLGRKI